MKVLLPGLLVFFLVGCQNTPVHPAFNYRADIGVAAEKTGQSCLYLLNAELEPGKRVQFVTTTTPPVTGEMDILKKADETCRDSDQDRPGAIGYSFKVVRGALPRAAPAFVVANFGRVLIATETGVSADLDGDGGVEFFRSCTSSEGVHLTIWKNKPLEGVRKWHAYYYLGYDVTSNCTDSETKPDSTGK